VINIWFIVKIIFDLFFPQVEEVKPTAKTVNLVNLVKKSAGPVTHRVKLFNHLYINSMSLMTENKLK